MIIYISMTVLVVVFGILYENDKQKNFKRLDCANGLNVDLNSNPHSNLLFFILIFATFVFVTGLQSGYGDTSNYIKQFNNLDYSFKASLTIVWDNEKSPLFRIYMAFIKGFTEDAQWFLLITSLLSNYFVCRVLKNESSSVPIACYFYICSGLCLWAMNGIRQYLVATIFFACYKLIVKGKWLKWFLLVFILYFCHTSVIFLIPMYFLFRKKPWTKTTILFIAALLVVGVFYSQFSNAFFDVAEGTVFEEYSTQVNDVASTKFIRVAFMSIPAVLSFIFRKDIEVDNSPVLNIASNAAVLSAGMYFLAGIGAGNLIARLAVYSDLFVYVIFVPYIIKKLLDTQYFYVAHLYIVAAGIFYFYQTFIVGGGIWYSDWLHWYFV